MASAVVKQGAAKAFLLKSNSQGLNLYDHLSEVLSEILKSKPDDALAELEAISARIKRTRFTTGSTPGPQATALDEATVQRALELIQLHYGPAATLDPDTCQMTIPRVNKPAYTRAPAEATLMESAELFEKAGVGMGKAEFYRVALAVKKLGESNAELKSVRFFGKVFGSKADYYVCEAETSERAPVGLPVLTEDQKYVEKAIDAEAPGVGANRCVYFVCTQLGSSWARLPDVTPAQIMSARGLKRLFTGDLGAPVGGFPAFPGDESSLLRAQLCVISSETAIAPADMLEVQEDEEEEAEEEEDESGASKDPKEPRLAPVEEFEAGEVAEMAGEEGLAKWVHTGRPLLGKQGRCSWYAAGKDPRKVKVPKEGEEEEEEEEEEEPEAVEEPEEAKAMLRTIGEDDEEWKGKAEEDADAAGFMPPWTTRVCSSALSKGVVAVVKSNVWPGATAVVGKGGKAGIRYANLYFGDGNSYSSKPYSPALPPPVQMEYDAAPLDAEEVRKELKELTDPTVAQEEEAEAAAAAEEESAVPGEGEEEDEE